MRTSSTSRPDRPADRKPLETCRGWPALILLVLILAGCRANAADATTGGAAAPGGVPAIVTRLIERVTIVTPTPDPAQTAEPREPVALDISLSGALPNLDPGVADSETQQDLAQNLFVGLTNYNAETYTIEPELAERWEIGPDGRTWTFHLRDDVNWVRPNRPLPGSGDNLWSAAAVRPVTADDVVFAVQRLCARDVESPQAFALFIIEGCERVFTNLERTDADRAAISIRAVDPTTLEVRLTRPAGYFLTLTSMPFFRPVPCDLAEELESEWLNSAGDMGTGWQTPDNLITSGPFFPVSGQITSRNMTLHRNPLWPLPRAGNIDVVNVSFLEDELDAYELWNDRVLDFAPLPAEEREAFLKRAPGKAQLIPDPVLFYVAFDFGSQVFREPEARRAFSAAIDRQRLVEEINDERGLPMRHAGVPEAVAAIPVDEVGVGYSPDYARLQMAASTFRSCKLMPEVRMLVSSADLSLRLAELIRDMWVEELECLPESISIEQVQFGELLAATARDALGRPDLWELAWAPTMPDTHNLLSDLLHCEDSENRQNRDCSEADTLLRQAGTATDPAERAALYRQAEGLFFNENGIFPIAPLYLRGREIVVHDWVTFNPAAFGGQQWDRIALDASLKALERSRS